MFLPDDIAAALQSHLPADLHPAVPALAQILADATTGVLRPDDSQVALQACLAAHPNLVAALRAFAGQEVNAGSSVISFGAGAQMGNVSIGDVAGRDIVKLHVDVQLDVHQTIETQPVINAQTGASTGSVIDSQTNYYNSYAALMRSPQEQRNRRAMLQKVRAIWITGFLEKSLTDELRIELNLTDRPDVVDIPVNALYQEREGEPQPLPSGTNIIDVFDQAGGELLILGVPGAGKTTLLLELLSDLLQRADGDETHPIPVVFPLSTWVVERKPLKEWMVDQLNGIYDVPRKIGQGWVDENEVLPLLDGLDEVAIERRDDCVEVINNYRSQLGGLAPAAVASRIADYEALERKLRLKGAVLIEPLMRQQVEGYMARVGEPLWAVQGLLESDPDVMELLDSPLMLSIITLAFRDASPETLQVRGTVEERRRRLWEAYIKRMFTRGLSGNAFTLEQTKYWIGSLAQLMATHNQIIFYKEMLIMYTIIVTRARLTFERLFISSFGLFAVVILLVSGALLSIGRGAVFAATTVTVIVVFLILSYERLQLRELIRIPAKHLWSAIMASQLQGQSMGFWAWFATQMLEMEQQDWEKVSGGYFSWKMPITYLPLKYGVWLCKYSLYLTGYIPRNIEGLLDLCVDRLFLRRVGGGYIFIHRMLMEHFAAMTDEDIARLSGEIEVQGNQKARKS